MTVNCRVFSPRAGESNTREIAFSNPIRLFIGFLQGLHVNLFHLKHCLHDSFRFLGILVLQHLV